jgi:NADH-quinone oxidoreductase subunit M
MATLSVVAILYGAMMSLAQQDMKKLVAYSSVSHMGFVTLGIAAVTSEGLSGSVAQMLNHGVSTSAIFLLVGMLYERRHHRAMSEFGGLAQSTPALAAFFFLAILSSIGLPGTNGFIGEFLILAGSWNSRLMHAPWFAAAGALGVILGAVYMLWMYQRVFFGPLRRVENRNIRDLSVREWAVLLPFAALIFFIGVLPQPLLDRIEPATQRLVARMERGRADQVGTPPAAHPAPAIFSIRPSPGGPVRLPAIYPIPPGLIPGPLAPAPQRSP